MPCYCPEDSPSQIRNEAYVKELTNYVSVIIEKLTLLRINVSGHACTDKVYNSIMNGVPVNKDELTNALCNMIRSLPEQVLADMYRSRLPLHVNICRWFKEHCIDDEKRLSEDKIEYLARSNAKSLVISFLTKIDKECIDKSRSSETVERIISEALESLVDKSMIKQIPIADKILGGKSS